MHSLKDSFPIYLTEDGIDISINDEQPKNAEFSIETIEYGFLNIILFNDEHPKKLYSTIDFTDDRIDISVNEEHPEKTEFLNVVTENGIEICIKNKQSLKKESPINFTKDGIDISVNNVQLIGNR